MPLHNTPEHPNLVATFDNQGDAVEALHGLQIAGFGGARVGCFYRTPEGDLETLDQRNRRVGGAVLGLVIGAALGALVARGAAVWVAGNGGPIDLTGAMITGMLFGVAIGGVIGWVIGARMHCREIAAPGTGLEPGAYVVAVAAGADRDRAWAVLRQYGGREHLPGSSPHAAAGPIPGASPA